MSPVMKFSGESKDMTLDELAEAVALAQKAGLPGSSPIHATLSTNNKIKEIEIPVDKADR